MMPLLAVRKRRTEEKGFFDLPKIPKKASVQKVTDALFSVIITGGRRKSRRLYRFLRLWGITREQCRGFLGKIPELRQTARQDLLAAYAGDPAARSHGEILLCYPGFRALEIQRAAHILWEMQVPLLPRALTEAVHSQTGIDMHPGARIGAGCFIDHGTGIVIGETAVLGQGIKLYQGVTLGALTTRGGQALQSKKRHPTVSDGVTIYANASVLGGDTVIGENCVIGANALVTVSVPPNTTVTA